MPIIMGMTQNYFDTLSSALDEAFHRAIQQGAEFDTKETEEFCASFGPVNYGQTVRGALPAFKYKGRLFGHKRAMTVVICRMESGRYELTTYLN